jgi:hypothetical protein
MGTALAIIGLVSAVGGMIVGGVQGSQAYDAQSDAYEDAMSDVSYERDKASRETVIDPNDGYYSAAEQVQAQYDQGVTHRQQTHDRLAAAAGQTFTRESGDLLDNYTRRSADLIETSGRELGDVQESLDLASSQIAAGRGRALASQGALTREKTYGSFLTEYGRISQTGTAMVQTDSAEAQEIGGISARAAVSGVRREGSVASLQEVTKSQFDDQREDIMEADTHAQSVGAREREFIADDDARIRGDIVEEADEALARATLQSDQATDAISERLSQTQEEYDARYGDAYDAMVEGKDQYLAGLGESKLQAEAGAELAKDIDLANITQGVGDQLDDLDRDYDYLLGDYKDHVKAGRGSYILGGALGNVPGVLDSTQTLYNQGVNDGWLGGSSANAATYVPPGYAGTGGGADLFFTQ